MYNRPVDKQLDIVILGLSITSSWGNGHATTYRGLIKQLDRLGHKVIFLERDVPWYAANRDMPAPPFCRAVLYADLPALYKHADLVRKADLVIVGSYVPQGVDIGKWVVNTACGVIAFYDIDTPVTLAKLQRGDFEYLHPDLIPAYNIYLSFTGGATLQRIEKQYGSPAARALYCSVDPELYYPDSEKKTWDIGYLGTYSTDRQPPLQTLMLDAAAKCQVKKFVVAGPQYPADIQWPENVERIEHLPPAEHRKFFNSQRFTMNITRADMIQAGFSPSVRLFEAAACGTPIISDYWEGLNSFFEDSSEILVAKSSEDTIGFLQELSEDKRLEIGEKARQKVLQKHTAAHRAQELIGYYKEAIIKD